MRFNRFLIPFCLILLSVSFFAIGSISRIWRWTISEQVGLMDNLILNSELYPSNLSPIFQIVSVYPPGTAIVGYIFSLVISPLLIPELLMIINAMVILLFSQELLRFTRLIQSFRVDSGHFYNFFLFYVIICCAPYVPYIFEFKPDIISFLIGFFALNRFLSNSNKKHQLLLSLVLGCGILFKQQYIIFPFLFVFYSLIFFPQLILYSTLSLFVSLGIILWYYSVPNIWYWTNTVLSDDGLIDFSEFIVYLLKGLGPFFVISIILLSLNRFDLFGVVKKKINQNIKFKFAFFFLISLAAINSLGFIKHGGNAGNIALSLIFLFPVIYILLFSLLDIKPSKWLISLIILSLLAFPVGSLSQSINKYKDYNLFADEIKKTFLVDGQNKSYLKSILFESDSYYFIRSLRYYDSFSIEFDNISFMATKCNFTMDLAFGSYLKNKTYDLIILKSVSEDQKVLLSQYNYQLFFSNSSGFIYKQF